ncbi:MAG: hypothetical protein KGI33_11950 [Thaumarchaeota archaeon]|nr:hypothetical protein [Nitrososphaerota archaeon]
MIPPQVRYKMWRHNHGKRWLDNGRMPATVIRELYPEKALAIGELRASIGPRSDSEIYKLANTLWRLKRGGIVEGRRHGSYRLTDLGRWLAISDKLGLAFLELCVLACACCVQTRYAAAGRPGYYMRPYFERVLGEYYSRGYLDKIFSLLKRKGFATRYVKKTIMVYPDVCNDLMARYGPYLERLESWLWGLQEAELGIFEGALEGLDRDKDSNGKALAGKREAGGMAVTRDQNQDAPKGQKPTLP